jgi:hypothetical protein
MGVLLRRAVRLLTVSLVCTAAACASTVYTDLSSFLAATAPGYYLEDFNALVLPPNYVPFVDFAGSTFTYTASAPGGVYVSQLPGNQIFGVNLWGDLLTFSFTSGNVTAVGGYYFETNVSNEIQPGTGTVTLTFSDGSSFNLSSVSPPLFFGYIADAPLTSLIVQGRSSTFVSVDNFYVGESVPEPATAVLLLAGALLLAARRRIRA